MKVKNKLINNLFGEELTIVMYEMLEEFYSLDYEDDDILRVLKKFNESFRTGMYLLALEQNFDNIAYRINRVNKKLNLIRKDKFLEAYDKKKTDEFLATIGKADKISLLSDLGVDLPLEERMKLPKKKLEYYKIISNSVMQDQENDTRNGIDTFLKHKKGSRKISTALGLNPVNTCLRNMSTHRTAPCVPTFSLTL